MGADPAQGWACKQSSDMKRPKGPLCTAVPRKRERAEAFAKANRPGGVYGGDGTILRPESVGFRQKAGGVGSVGGACPSAHQLVKGGCLPARTLPPRTLPPSNSPLRTLPPDATKPLPAIDPTALPLTNSYNLRRPQGPLLKFSQKNPNILLTKGEIGGIIHIKIRGK